MNLNLRGLLLLGYLGLGLQMWSNPSYAQNVDRLAFRAREIVCTMSMCVSPDIRVIRENYKNYNGYYHIAGNYVSVRPGQSDLGELLTLVHEFTHVYRSQFNAHEETWLSEGLAKLVEYKVSTVWPISYEKILKNSPELIFENSEKRYTVGGSGYSDSFFLVYYLYRHFGADQLLTKLLQSKLSGWASVIQAISELQASGAIAKNESILNEIALLRHFAIALLLNDQFTAKYALFYVGEDFTPLNESGFTEVDLAHLVPSKGHKVVLSRSGVAAAAVEKYVVESLNPLMIKALENSQPQKTGLYYISIF